MSGISNIYINTSNRLLKRGTRTSESVFIVVYLKEVLYKLLDNYLKYLMHAGYHNMLI
jgi:hypothetical protein